MKKIGFVSSEKPEAEESLKSLKKLYDNVPPKEAEIIVALGGDGTILKSLHKFLKKGVPIYGMNRGYVGFLMNQFSEKNLEKRLNEAIPYKLHPLKIKSYNSDGKISEGLAFNDVSMIRNSASIAKIKIQVNNKTRIEEYLGYVEFNGSGFRLFDLNCLGISDEQSTNFRKTLDGSSKNI